MAHYNDENITSIIKIIITYYIIMFMTIFYDNIGIVIKINHHKLLVAEPPSYWAHMHPSLSQRPQTAMHVHQITQKDLSDCPKDIG
jgi:hypothetical protein